MSSSAARVRWKEGEKEEMIALRKKHPELTIAQFTERFYPHRTAKAMGQTLWMFNQMAKVEARQKEKEKRSQNDDQVGKSLDAGATTPSATTTADTFSNSDEEEDSNPDDPNEDIGWEREQTPSKRIKLTYSTRSRASLNSSRDSAVLRSRSSEYPGSSLKSTPILSPQVGGRHSTASIAEQASHDQDAQTNTFNTTPVLSPPALAPAPPPPPPPPQQQQQQIAEEQTQPAQLDTIEKQSDQLQPQTSQASEDTVKQDNIISPSEIRRQFAQQNAALYPLLEMALSHSEASETEKLRIENELIALQKEYESTRADKERQIAQLQGELDRCRNERDEWLNGRKELDRLVIENENLRSRLRKVFEDVADAAHGL